MCCDKGSPLAVGCLGMGRLAYGEVSDLEPDCGAGEYVFYRAAAAGSVAEASCCGNVERLPTGWKPMLRLD